MRYIDIGVKIAMGKMISSSEVPILHLLTVAVELWQMHRSKKGLETCFMKRTRSPLDAKGVNDEANTSGYLNQLKSLILKAQ